MAQLQGKSQEVGFDGRIKIGMKAVRHNGYAPLRAGQGPAASAWREEKGEVAISRKIFAEIPFQIDRSPFNRA